MHKYDAQGFNFTCVLQFYVHVGAHACTYMYVFQFSSGRTTFQTLNKRERVYIFMAEKYTVPEGHATEVYKC